MRAAALAFMAAATVVAVTGTVIKIGTPAEELGPVAKTRAQLAWERRAAEIKAGLPWVSRFTANAHASGQDFKSLLFLKFHKVGSSTAAVKLGRAGIISGLKQNCLGGGEGTFCVEHWGLKVARNLTLGSYPMERWIAQWPEPFLVTLLREPIEKFMSFIYYKAWLDRVVPTQEWFDSNIDMLWNGTAEYNYILGYMEPGVHNVNVALKALDEFHVVGITQDISGLFAQISYILGIDSKELYYQSVTTMPNRPHLENLTLDFQKEAYRVMATEYPGEQVIYDRAYYLHTHRLDEYELHDLREEIERESSNPDQISCDTKVHEAGVQGGGRTCIDPFSEHP